jgi:hypothetical protein
LGSLSIAAKGFDEGRSQHNQCLLEKAQLHTSVPVLAPCPSAAPLEEQSEVTSAVVARKNFSIFDDQGSCNDSITTNTQTMASQMQQDQWGEILMSKSKQ